MKPLIFCGYHNSGKTSFIEKTLKVLIERGFSVCTIKHSSEGIDSLGGSNDSSRLLKAGSSSTVLMIDSFDIFFKRAVEANREGAIKRLHNILSSLKIDFALIEGFKSYDGPIPKVVFGNNRDDVTALVDDFTVGYSGAGIGDLGIKDILYLPQMMDKDELFSFVEKNTVEFLPGTDCGECGFSSCRELAKRILRGEKSLEDCIVRQKDVELYINDRQIPMKGFVKSILKATVKGFVENLRDYEDGELRLIIR